MNYASRDPIPFGTCLASPLDAPFVIWSDDPELRPHLDRPWMRAYATAYLGADAPPDQTDQLPGQMLAVPHEALVRHTCVFGSTGSGKSRLTLHLIDEQIRQGCSVVAMDPKPQTIAQILDRARSAGLNEGQIVLLSPSDTAMGVPGWNPLLTDVPPEEAAAGLVDILAQSTSSWGPRLSDILSNALVLLAAHRLSLFELQPLLTEPAYRAGLLRTTRPAPHSAGNAAYREAHRFFSHEFSAWTRSEQAGAVGPVLNKTRPLLRSDFLQALLCARRNTLDLAGLWQTQRVVLIHLDRTALGDEGARLFGGLLAHQLYRTALRAAGPNPVVLALDELGAQERFLGKALSEVATVARSQNLRLQVATQHPGQLTDAFRADLLKSTQVQAFFQLDGADARPIAADFAAGVSEPLRRVTARVGARNRNTGWAERTVWHHPVLDTHGQSLRLSARQWDDMQRCDLVSVPGDGYALRRLQELGAASGVPRLYVAAADTGRPVALSRYVAGLSDVDYWFEGPAPLVLIVSFPAPQFVHAQKRAAADVAAMWVRILQGLPPQHAVVRLLRGEPQIVRILDIDVPNELRPDLPWHRAARKANALPWPEINAALDWRGAQIEALSGHSRAQLSGEDRPPRLSAPARSSALPPPAEKAAMPRPALLEREGSKQVAAKAVTPQAEILYHDDVAEDGSIA